MLAFDQVFFDAARAESLAITLFKVDGGSEQYLFRELYCDEPRCDCRRVELQVVWVEQHRVEATIHYAFERSRRRGEPQIFLDPLTSPSERSKALLAAFIRLIEQDANRERLHRHYAMFKQAVNDPSHPAHAMVRSGAQDEPALRPPPSARRQPAKRGTRGGAGASRGEQRTTSAALERVLGAASTSGSERPLQKKFRQLLKKVEGLRQRLRAWQAARPDIARELAVLAARQERYAQRLCEMVRVLDRALGNATVKLTRAERGEIVETIRSISSELLAQGVEDDELQAISERHRPHRKGRAAELEAQDDAATLAVLKGMLGDLGFDVDGVQTLDELQMFAAEKLGEVEASAEQKTPHRPRKKSARQLANEARRAEADRAASKSVQDVYRELARALHPDREQDPAAQARKTEAMREVNAAYEAKDLLRLLELQLQLDEVDASRVESIAEERLRHYNRVLEQQARQLADELAEVELPFRLDLGLGPRAKLSSSDVMTMIRDDLARADELLGVIERDLAAFEDLKQLKAWAREEARQRRLERAMAW